MAVPDLVFPDLADEPIDRIWEAIKTVVRSDANLKVVRTLRLWEGHPDDAYPPTAAEMPFLRITPMNSQMIKGDEASWLTDLIFKYELAVAGTKMRNLFRLNGALRNAFNYNAPVGTDQTVSGFLRDSGGAVHSFRLAAIGPLGVPGVKDVPGGATPIQNLASNGTFAVRTYLAAISPTP